MTDDELKKLRKKATKWGALIGALIALACHFVPQDYRAVCNTVATICTGGIK